MDKREELRSLYCVVCPRCESVSPADDISCPYCGADRHGAVLTRAQASLFEIDEAARAMVRAASSQVSDPGRDAAWQMTRARNLGDAAALLPSQTAIGIKRNWIAVLAVSVCVLLGTYGWVRNAHGPDAVQSRDSAVSAAGTVHKVAPMSPAARPVEPAAVESGAREASIPPAQDRFLSLAGALGAASFSLPVSSFTSSCTVTAGAAPGAGIPLCDTSVPTTAQVSTAQDTRSTDSVVPDSLERTKPTATASAEVASTKAVSRTHSRVASRRASARHQSSHVHARASEKTGHAQPALRSVRHAKKNDKTHPRTRSAQRAPASERRDADGFNSQPARTVAPAANPAMTSSGSWAPSTASESDRNRWSAENLLRLGTPTVNRGRGDAH